MKLAAVVLVLTATTATARAEQVERLDGRWRLENSLGFRSGSFLVNNIDMAKLQGHVDLGVRKGRWTMFGEYSLMELGVDREDLAARGVIGTVSNGLLHRVGTNARYAYTRSTLGAMAFELYGEVGAGVQHMRWDAGGTWTRPDVALGIGSTSWGAGRSRHGGTTLGLRVLLSRRSDLPDDAPIACGGPCDGATRPTGFDRSFMLDFSLHFGLL